MDNYSKLFIASLVTELVTIVLIPHVVNIVAKWVKLHFCCCLNIVQICNAVVASYLNLDFYKWRHR